MTTNQPTPPAATEKAPKEMTAAEAAKAVRRKLVVRAPVVEDGEQVIKDGKPAFREQTKFVPIKADEVLSFKDYGSHVVVVTNDGKKFNSADAE